MSRRRLLDSPNTETTGDLAGVGTSLHADFPRTIPSLRCCLPARAPNRRRRTPMGFRLVKRSCQDGGGDALVGPNTSMLARIPRNSRHPAIGCLGSFPLHTSSLSPLWGWQIARPLPRCAPDAAATQARPNQARPWPWPRRGSGCGCHRLQRLRTLPPSSPVRSRAGFPC